MEDKKMILINDINEGQKIVELLTILKIDGIEYAVYSMDRDTNVSDVYAARVVKNDNGTDSIVSIEDEAEKMKVFQIIDKMINEG